METVHLSVSATLVRHPSGFIKNLQSTEYQTGRQNGNIQGASIVSTQKITEGKYEAEHQITLLPGFEATAQDQFSAEIKPQSTQYQWQYALTDHLGNVRVLFTDKNNDGLIAQSVNDKINEVLSIRNYSPFGLELGGSHKNLDYQNPYRFGGKEHSNFTGYSNFGGRWYDSNRSGWNQVDPLAEHPNQVTKSTYSAFWSNPIIYNDPDGKCPSCPQGEQASQFYAKGANVTNQYGSWNWTGNAWQEAPRIGEYKPDMADRWREGNLLQQSAYSFVDGIYSIFANTHLGGKAFESYDDKIKTRLGGLLTLGGPILSGGGSAVSLADDAAKTGSNLWKVGAYNELQGLETGLQAHHVGQKSLMSKLVPGYNPANAPSILVPEIGHVTNMPGIGRVAATRGLGGFTNARQVLARDIFELRHVYGGQGIPNSSLQQLIQKNKTIYPGAFIK